MFSKCYKTAGAHKAFTVSDAMFYKLPLSICSIEEQEAFKAFPLSTLAQPGCERRSRPNVLVRLTAVVIHIKRLHLGLP